MMSERIRIKVGELELDWESDGRLSLDNVRSLLKEIETLSPPPPSSYPFPVSTPPLPEGQGNPNGTGATEPQKLFVTSIAAKLGVKNGADLARASAAYLQITEGKESFTRQDLLETMRKAPRYYKENMRKNLSKIVAGLIPGTFNQVSSNVYSLTASEHSAIEAALA